MKRPEKIWLLDEFENYPERDQLDILMSIGKECCMRVRGTVDIEFDEKYGKAMMVSNEFVYRLLDNTLSMSGSKEWRIPEALNRLEDHAEQWGMSRAFYEYVFGTQEYLKRTNRLPQSERKLS